MPRRRSDFHCLLLVRAIAADPAKESRHIWIGEEALLGKGYGTRMMREAIGRCFADPSVRAILIDPLASNERAQRFYQRFGFRPVARQRFGADECLVHRLERRDWLESPREQ